MTSKEVITEEIKLERARLQVQIAKAMAQARRQTWISAIPCTCDVYHFDDPSKMCVFCRMLERHIESALVDCAKFIEKGGRTD